MKAGPFYFSMANSDPIDIIDAGLGLDHLGLNVLAWAESGSHALDGRVPMSRIKRLPGWSQKRQDRLVAAGVWLISLDDVVVLEGYLDVNRSREDIYAIREKQRLGGQHGGQERAQTAQRDDRGQFVTTPRPLAEVRR
jgi:hypothetical protein